MTTMSDDGERTCPLCAEEMDLTDQQLKPCKCGYEICVWCWHHIMDMAEKDDTEGRCPACRTPYDKERIVGMAATCERVVAEVSAEKKQKSQKTKPKTSVEARKHLNSVRVIQRNLVYIIGLPSNLADESLLERREYFGQYGRVLKVSISRPAGGAQQTSNSNTFSVYITYAREEEAVRCIQAVHNFVLDGKALRACFGTTKYCRAWLRNMACNNPECLYLHDIGSQEDSFTKDEIISAYTRSRVPVITSGNMNRRTGTVLPPPADDFCSSMSGSASKNLIKGPANTSVSHSKGSPPEVGGSGRSAVLPAAASWGLRANSRPPSLVTPSLQGTIKQKPELLNNSSTPSISASTSAWNDDVVSASKIAEESRTVHLDGRCRPLESFRSSSRDSKMGLSISSADVDHVRASSAWYDDDVTSIKTLEESAATRTDCGSVLVDSSKLTRKDSCTVLSNSSSETSFTKRTSAWYDDELSASDVPEKSHAVQFGSQARHLDASAQLVGMDSQTISNSLVDITHPKEISAWDDDVVATSVLPEGNLSCKQTVAEASESSISGDFLGCASDLSSETGGHTSYVSVTSLGQSPSLVAQVVDRNNVVASDLNLVNNVHTGELDQLPHDVASHKADNSCTVINGNTQSLSSRFSMLDLDKHSGISLPNLEVHSSVTDGLGRLKKSASGLRHYSDVGSLSLMPSGGDTVLSQDAPASRALSGWTLEPRKQDSDAKLGHGPSNVAIQPTYLPYSSGASVLSSASSNHTDTCGAHDLVDVGSRMSSLKINEKLHLPRGDNALSNGHIDSKFCSSGEAGENLEYPNLDHVGDKRNHAGGLNNFSDVGKAVSADTGESTIISNILTMDFDPWDDSSISKDSFAKLLGEADEQNASLKMTNLWKGQNNRQSRFSFARQEGQTSFSKPSFTQLAHAQTNGPVLQDPLGAGLRNGFTASSYEDPVALNNSSGHSFMSTERSAVISRAKTSAPPGFSVPNRLQAPPPGFTSQDRYDQAYDTMNSENLILGGSSLKSEYLMPAAGNIGDVEFIDPAILAVGKGRLPHGEDSSGFDLRYTFQSQLNSSEIDPRLQLLLQQSVSPHQDLRTTDSYGARFLPLSDSYIPSRNVHQNLSSLSPFSLMSLHQSRNSQWEGWNDVQASSESGVRDLLRNKRLGLNRYFPGNEEKFPTGDLYNRGFGM